MLENSIWKQYNPNLSIQDALSKIYGCESHALNQDEVEVYNLVKRFLTKKELRSFAMITAGVSKEEIKTKINVNDEELEELLRKASRKIRQSKIRDTVKITQNKL